MIRIILLVLILLIGAPSLIMLRFASNRVYTDKTVPPHKVAVVFGAGLTAEGRATTVLKDRIATAAALYNAGKVEKLLMSGDNRFINYNEPGAMKDYALQIGVPEEVIVLDYAGRRTYDTCYRAKEIFQLSEVILVTQNFHLPRALYTCSSLGLEAVGVSADMRSYRDTGYWNIREIPARLIAFIQVHLTHPEPVLGDQEPILPLE
ncbi:MAG: YdcF family protein [Anaerolineales bacterium]|nr:YdcF family protein [Anaerolineales bacterium]